MFAKVTGGKLVGGAFLPCPLPHPLSTILKMVKDLSFKQMELPFEKIGMEWAFINSFSPNVIFLYFLKRGI